MAQDERININIGTKADPSGLTTINKSAKSLGTESQKAKTMLGTLLTEMKGLDGPMGAVAQGFENIAVSMAQMGVAGAIIGTFKTAADMWLASVKEAQDAEIARLRALGAEMALMQEAIFDKKIISYKASIDAIRDGMIKVTAEFQNSARLSQEMAGYMNQIANASRDGSVTGLQIEKLKAVMAEEEESAKTLIAARYDLKIAQEKVANSEQKYAQSVEAAEQKLRDNVQAHSMTERAIDALTQEMAILGKEYRAMSKTTKDGVLGSKEQIAYYQKLKQEYGVAQTNLTKLTQEEAKLRADIQKGEKQVALEKTRAANAEKQSQLELLNATNALETAERTLEQALKEEAEAARKAADAAKKKADAEYNLAMEEQEARDRAKHQNEILQEALTDIEKRLKEAEESAKKSARGMDTDQRVSDYGGRGYDYDLDANGNIRDFVDWQRAQRFGDRAARDEADAEKANSAWQKKADDILEKQEKGKKLSDREKEFLEDWNKFNDERNRKDLEKEAAELRKKMSEKVDEMEKHLSSIKKDLKDALEIN